MGAAAKAVAEPSHSSHPGGLDGVAPGTRFGRYAVIRPLAAGGMSELYLAAPVEPPPQPIALKRLLPHLAWDPEFVRMFLDEVRIVAGLDHPNIVCVLDFGVGEGGHFFAMEYLHGKNVREVLRRWPGPGAIPRAVAVGIVLEVAKGLAYAHSFTDIHGRPAPVVHRDVSPANVIVTYDGVVKLVDFGIAKVEAQTRHTRAGTIKGKIGYMSPEQCRGDDVDHRSDVFGLGIMLYELTVHRRAFYGDTDYGVMNRIIEGRFAPPSAVVADYPGELEEIVIRAMQVDPARRYPSASALAEDLHRFAHAQGLDVSAQLRRSFSTQLFGQPAWPSLEIPKTEPDPVAIQARASSRRRLLAPSVAIGVVLGGLGFVLGGMWTGGEIEVQGDPSTPTAATPPLPGVVPPTPAGEPRPSDLAPPEKIVEAEPDLAVAAEEPSPDGEAAEMAQPRKRRRSKRSRGRSSKKKRTGKSASEPASDHDRTLLPPSWH